MLGLPIGFCLRFLDSGRHRCQFVHLLACKATTSELSRSHFC